MTNLTLYNLIKKTSQEKNRPLKIICDWDDCLQPVKPMVVYRLNKHLIKDLKGFVKNYWEATIASPSVSGSQVFVKVENYQGSKEEAEAVNKFEEFRKESRKNPSHNFLPSGGDLYAESPFLSSADDLLQALKEDLISDLIIISSYRQGENTEFVNETAKIVVEQKTRKIKKSFMNFPQTKIEMTGHKRFKPDRWEVLRDKYPDFDIFIDDNPQIIKRCLENLPANHLYLTCDYACNRHLRRNNVQFFQVEVKSDITNRDFALGALEYRTNKLEQGIRELNQQAKVSFREPVPTWLITFPISSLVLACLVWIMVWKRKQSSN